MKKTLIDLPSMYADHHVLAVREALLSLPGVAGVQATASRRRVLVEHDETATDEKRLRETLTTAGYPPDKAPAAKQFPERHKEGSPWYAVIQRTTTTATKDREMAGDFRRY